MGDFESPTHILVTARFFKPSFEFGFCRVHQTLRVTPAMEAGLADHVWSLEELVGLLEVKVEAAA